MEGTTERDGAGHLPSDAQNSSQGATVQAGAPRGTYAVNRLIQELFADPANIALFQTNRVALYDRYGLSAEERAALDKGGQEALTGVGLHPLLQMSHFMATNPEAADFISIKAYKALVKRNG